MSDLIRYRNNELVMLGDKVMVMTFILFKHLGTVVYIPGISKFHVDMECNGMTYVGIKMQGNYFSAQTVDPKNNILLRVKLLNRGAFDERDSLGDKNYISEDEGEN